MIRKLESKDHPTIKYMLEAENAQDEYDKFINCEAYVIEDEEIIGFFGFNYEQGLPALKNFCVRKAYRTYTSAKKLIDSYIETIKGLGYDKTFLTSNKEYLNKLIEYYFEIKPYAKEDGFNFYATEV